MSAAVENGSTSPRSAGLLFLSRADVARSGGRSSERFVRAVTQALALHAQGDIAQPLKPYLRWRPDGHIADRIIAMPAYLGGTEPIAGLKWIGSKHDNPERLNVSIMDVEKDVFLKSDKVVVDDWDQCNREGKVLHQLTSEGRFTREDLHAELGQVVVGQRSGRENDSEIIVLNQMGTAIVDVACTKAVYDLAREAGVGTWLSL